ncbi:ABC transporter ATP-binding protein [Corynebacterium sp. sy039]|uniref:ABC transporter ATP-binding protein n=1 Tax=Corynebacterium sp. sy039 TaxID=2599641 RepID=UPI0011B69B73|nr:ABC transporter ATP-binding protein [Corynebacterium sp. sy039]QDZ43543.1 ABC transporter ATP-binding protein [Corynebacterium sp. sy039]
MEIHNLVKKYGTKTVVNNLSLKVRRGTVLAFLGTNGAGKTTTIEICEGFTKPSSGEVRVLGLNPVTHPDLVRQRVGIMLQSGGSYSGIRVGEMLKLSASYSLNPLDPEWLLDILGLANVRNTTYRRLSGGQQQRLSLALALIGRPELVFLDEPTAGMDAQSRLLVWKLIDQLRGDGVTVILTTHLMDEAEALADRVAIIDKGTLVAEGTLQELRKQHAASYNSPAGMGNKVAIHFSTAQPLYISESEFLSRLNVIAQKPLSYKALVPYPLNPTILAELSKEAAKQDVLITEFSTHCHSLEDIFLDITHHSVRS